MPIFIPSKIVSGGQTGADRAGLDAAIALGIPHGGWCPKGRKSEDGAIPAIYRLTETSSSDYLARTEWNVRDSEASLVFANNVPVTGGTKRTLDFAKKHGRPFLVVTPQDTNQVGALREWLATVRPAVLNVAGQRESKSPGIHAFAVRILTDALGEPTRS